MHETTVVGWDGSDTAETALEWAIARAELQPKGMRRLILVRAVDETLPEDAAQVLATTQADVAERARRIGAEHPSLDVEAAAVRGRTRRRPRRPIGRRRPRGRRGRERTHRGVLAQFAPGPATGRRSRRARRRRPDRRFPRQVRRDGRGRSRRSLPSGSADSRRTTPPSAARRCMPCTWALGCTMWPRTPRSSTVLSRRRSREHPDLIVVTHVDSGPTARALVRRARERATVFVGSRRRGPVRRMFLGSVSHALVTNARCATVVVPPVGGPGSEPDAPEA